MRRNAPRSQVRLMKGVHVERRQHLLRERAVSPRDPRVNRPSVASSVCNPEPENRAADTTAARRHPVMMGPPPVPLRYSGIRIPARFLIFPDAGCRADPLLGAADCRGER